MKVNYNQKGNNLDFVNSTNKTIPANTLVVIGQRVGVAGSDIAAGELGALIVDGVYSAAKTTDEEIEFGATLYYDESKDIVTTTKGEHVVAGFAASKASATDATVLVKINA